MEQGLDQINRLQSNKATMRLLPGEMRGGSILSVDNLKTSPWHWTVAVDNFGTKTTGEKQGSLSLGYDNLFKVSDLLNISLKRDLNGDTRKNSRNLSFYYEVPYGYWNAYYSYNYFDYVSGLSNGAIQFKSDGTSQTHDIGIRRVLYRNEAGITRFNLDLLTRQNNNYLEDVKLDTSSRRLTMMNLGLSQSYNIPQGFLYGGINFSQGVTWLGAERNNSFSSSPAAQFQKITSDIRVVKNFDIGLKQYNPLLETMIRGQWTPDLLYGSEQISIGGPFSVRGFKNSAPSGNVGFYAQNTLSVPVTLPSFSNMIGDFRPYIGYDIGKIQQQHRDGISGGTLSSVIFGIKSDQGIIDFDMAFSRPLTVPSRAIEKSAEIYFTISKSF